MSLSSKRSETFEGSPLNHDERREWTKHFSLASYILRMSKKTKENLSINLRMKENKKNK